VLLLTLNLIDNRSKLVEDSKHTGVYSMLSLKYSKKKVVGLFGRDLEVSSPS
jgi:hypothetical protein